jgi:hypothetical protein
MYITMGTAVYGYISYEFLGLSEALQGSLDPFLTPFFGGSILKWVTLEF